MSLEEIVMRAIPMQPGDCRIKKAQKERMRAELKRRIEEWHEANPKKSEQKIQTQY